MKINLIIGAGQLGSRHLQGLLKYNEQIQDIFVLDPSKSSLETASQRAKEFQHIHKLHFSQNWENLPKKFDLVIIASNSDVREAIVNKLCNNYTFEYLILEKVLFNDLNAYDRISHLFNKHKLKVWVNHPRRMFNSYQLLKSMLEEGLPAAYQVTGGNWGLGCNGLHFIDLFVFLSGSKLAEIDARWIDQDILESKRKGFIEFTGTVKGQLENGSSFQLNSIKGEPTFGTITILDAQKRILILESGDPQINMWSMHNGYKQESFPFEMEFQSSLTTKLAADLLCEGSCDLPTYEEAQHSHKFFIGALLEKFNGIKGAKSNILPIT